jgi:alpha-maltose-1-phosphate synthase
VRVGVAAAGRYHLLDLARELDALGIDVRFYSFVPWNMAKKFGLRRCCHVGFLFLLFPLVMMERVFPRVLPGLIERLMCYALDIALILRMRRCDVLICMSGLYLWAPRYAKWRYGTQIHLHRSSRHILSQKEILEALPGARQVSDFMVGRELAGYALADHIIVPSIHVAESFAPWPKCAAKLVINPLGVDLAQFPMQQASKAEQFTVLFVGQWSYRKGVDVLCAAVRQLPTVKLVHVGTLDDAPFPGEPQYQHHDHVPQMDLPDYYAAAHLFVLASQEDGFGVVLSQALASGLRVVCTERTGGPDLVRLAGIARLIKIVPPGDPNALREAIAQSLSDLTNSSVSPINDSERSKLGWRAYGERTLESMRLDMSSHNRLEQMQPDYASAGRTRAY